MAGLFEELDDQDTPLGELVLRRRGAASVPDEVIYEVTIAGEMLMSSTINASERALAHLALESRTDRPCDVLVGGLGLGYTAAAALEYPNVAKVDVVELLAPVIGWHRQRLVPMAGKLMDDERCTVVPADFFEYVGPGSSAPRYDAILLDIDHAPDSWLHERHGAFYSGSGLRSLADRLAPGGVFALWSAWEPAAEFLDLLGVVFQSVRSHEVSFYNPHASERDANWVVITEGDN